MRCCQIHTVTHWHAGNWIEMAPIHRRSQWNEQLALPLHLPVSFLLLDSFDVAIGLLSWLAFCGSINGSLSRSNHPMTNILSDWPNEWQSNDYPHTFNQLMRKCVSEKTGSRWIIQRKDELIAQSNNRVAAELITCKMNFNRWSAAGQPLPE